MNASRTPLHRQIRTLLQQAFPPGATLGRRRFLELVGSAAAVVAGGNTTFAVSEQAGPVAIVGGGVAGLTAAYRLMKAGRKVHLFEGSLRLGGRMFSKRNFNKEGMFVELGGELIDTNHSDIIALAKELGLETQNLLDGEKGEDVIYFEGKVHRHHDVLEAFKPLAAIIATDAAQVYDKEGNFTDHARKLDAISMGEYLQRASPGVEPWIIKLIIAAYEPEFGLEVSELSSLNLVDFIEPDTSKGFKIFGDSDEALRILGGNGSLPEALVKVLKGKIEMSLGNQLTQINLTEAGVKLTFAEKKKTHSSVWSRVILAVPFTLLRQVKGIDDLPFSSEKKRAIHEMGYGTNVKVMYGFKERFWRKPHGEPGHFGNGSVFADEPTFQNVWETSRGQTGDRGIITNLLGGKRGLNYTPQAMANYLDDLNKPMPGAKGQHDGNTAIMNWPKMPLNKGSYSCARVGQYTWIAKAAATTECDGRLIFAGEHTSLVSAGFMNGGVESGNRAAKEIIG